MIRRPRRFALTFALLLLATTVPTQGASTADWVTLIPTVENSIVRLEIEKGSGNGICTAVIFEIDKDGNAAALTAAHCVAHEPNERIDITVSGRTAHVVDSNSINDLAILRYRARSHESAIPLADKLPFKGEEVLVAGYAFGWKEIHEQFGHVSNPKNEESKATALDVTLIFGDSGGAAVNGAGRLIGINSSIASQGPARMGLVRSIEQIQDYIDAYHDQLKRQKP
jgi:S1-C subfamily serine protease